jgi:hypothetical protein
MWERIATSYGVLASFKEPKSKTPLPPKTVNFRSFSAQPTSNREVELMEDEDGGGWGCIYRQRLTEADALAEPSPLIDLPRHMA